MKLSSSIFEGHNSTLSLSHTYTHALTLTCIIREWIYAVRTRALSVDWSDTCYRIKSFYQSYSLPSHTLIALSPNDKYTHPHTEWYILTHAQNDMHSYTEWYTPIRRLTQTLTLRMTHTHTQNDTSTHTLSKTNTHTYIHRMTNTHALTHAHNDTRVDRSWQQFDVKCQSLLQQQLWNKTRSVIVAFVLCHQTCNRSLFLA